MTHEMTDKREQLTQWRMTMVGLTLLLGFGVVIGRLMQLHMSSNSNLSWVAEKQHHAVVPMAQKRGKILDAQGRELAVSIPVRSIFADPSEVPDAEATLDAIDAVMPLGDERAMLSRRMRRGRRFAWVRRRVATDVAANVEALNLAGIHFLEESRRVYPNGTLASQLLGVVGYDAQPLAGIEMAYDAFLGGTRRHAIYQRDARGRYFFTPVGVQSMMEEESSVQRWTNQTDSIPPRRRSTREGVGHVALTIDKIIQYATDEALARAAAKARAKGAMAVVVEVDTGRVLAMSSVPTFDPNSYWKYPQESWRNRAVTDSFEPGSTFKVLIAAAALEHGVNPHALVYCENGQYRVGRALLHDHNAYGQLDMAGIIRVSSNIGAAKLASQLGQSALEPFLRQFGVGTKSQIDFPGEVGGVLRGTRRWQPVELATVGFGQGLLVSPLQMTMAMASLANGGRLMQPYLVEDIRGDDGTVWHHREPREVRRVVRPETAMLLRAMLQQVVQPGGTGQAASSSLYTTAGKTGTAQKVTEGIKGYAKGKYFASFVGFAPVENPRIAVFVGIDEPVGAYYGGQVAAPAFREIVETTLQYLEVPTSGAPVIMAAATSASEPGSVDRAALATGEQRIFSVVREGVTKVPALAGLSLRQVVRLAHEAGVLVRADGSGMVVAQRPAEGRWIKRGEEVGVSLRLP